MLQLTDQQAMRLHAEARRADLLASMRAARAGRIRWRLGRWLARVGERLAAEPRMRPAADCR